MTSPSATADSGPTDVDRMLGDLHDVLSAARARQAWSVTGMTPFGDGHSGFTYLVEATCDGEDRRLVLRTSAPGARLRGPDDVGRQGRIISALGRSGLPLPEMIACSSEPTLAGRSFALMELVPGVDWTVAAREGSHAGVAREAVDFLARLRLVPPSHTGVADEEVLVPVDEVRRWGRLLPRTPDWVEGPARELQVRLERSAPPLSRPALVHGDFHYGNLLFQEGRLAAVLDWEIAALGDPVFDLGCLAVASMRKKYEPEPNSTGSVDVEPEELCRLYGVDVSLFAWYFAASCFKYAAILGYNLMLHRTGRRTDVIYEELLGTTRGLVTDGMTLLEGAR